LCLILSVFVLVGCSEEKSKSQGFKVAVMEGQAVFAKSRIAMDGLAYAEEIEAKRRARRDEITAKISEKPDDEALKSSLEKEKREIEIAAETVQRGIGDKIYKLFEQTVTDYRKANNIEIVLPKEAAISFDEQADITDIIVELMDKSDLNFREEPLPAVLNTAPDTPAAPVQDKPEEQVKP
jgi:Skp family chaperone for outer membrane proteins